MVSDETNLCKCANHMAMSVSSKVQNCAKRVCNWSQNNGFNKCCKQANMVCTSQANCKNKLENAKMKREDETVMLETWISDCGEPDFDNNQISKIVGMTKNEDGIGKRTTREHTEMTKMKYQIPCLMKWPTYLGFNYSLDSNSNDPIGKPVSTRTNKLTFCLRIGSW